MKEKENSKSIVDCFKEERLHFLDGYTEAPIFKPKKNHSIYHDNEIDADYY